MNRIGQLVILTSILGTATAHADEAADKFAAGKAALKANKIKEACDAFAQSETSRAAVETELALAGCLEKDGKLVGAAKYYRLAADKDTDKKRAKTSMDKAAKLEARAPKLRFAINPNPPGIVVKVDGVDVAATGDVLVDIGPHEITATAPGYAGRANAPVDREGQILDVILRMEALEPPPTERKPEPPTPAEPPTTAPTPPAEEAAPAMVEQPPPADAQPSKKRRNGLIVGGIGVAAIVGAGILFGVGSNLQSDSDGICPNNMCNNEADFTKATDYREDGRLYRGIGLGVGIGGVALLAAGVIMFATAPKESPPVALRLDSNGGSVAYTFGF